MFNKKPLDKSNLELSIDALHAEMTNFTGDSDEYTKMSDNLSKLYKLRETESQKRVSPDTIALIASNLLGILMIVGHERTHVIATKALNFVTKLK